MEDNLESTQFQEFLVSLSECFKDANKEMDAPEEIASAYSLSVIRAIEESDVEEHLKENTQVGHFLWTLYHELIFFESHLAETPLLRWAKNVWLGQFEDASEKDLFIQRVLMKDFTAIIQNPSPIITPEWKDFIRVLKTYPSPDSMLNVGQYQSAHSSWISGIRRFEDETLKAAVAIIKGEQMVIDALSSNHFSRILSYIFHTYPWLSKNELGSFVEGFPIGKDTEFVDRLGILILKQDVLEVLDMFLEKHHPHGSWFQAHMIELIYLAEGRSQDILALREDSIKDYCGYLIEFPASKFLLVQFSYIDYLTDFRGQEVAANIIESSISANILETLEDNHTISKHENLRRMLYQTIAHKHREAGDYLRSLKYFIFNQSETEIYKIFNFILSTALHQRDTSVMMNSIIQIKELEPLYEHDSRFSPIKVLKYLNNVILNYEKSDTLAVEENIYHVIMILISGFVSAVHFGQLFYLLEDLLKKISNHVELFSALKDGKKFDKHEFVHLLQAFQEWKRYNKQNRIQEEKLPNLSEFLSIGFCSPDHFSVLFRNKAATN